MNAVQKRSIMGSGGLIVMDDTSCHGGRSALLHGILHGRKLRQVHPCRAGTVQMHDTLVRITKGEATETDIELLKEML
jgi:NADH:ubiquinone oxidoreductase subunit F (NADH-binding)